MKSAICLYVFHIFFLFTVYGYNDAVDIFGGWVFEAETNCLSEHNMGQVASSGQNDFSFFNKKSIQSPDELQGYLDVLMKTRQDISDGNLVYDPSKTYMTFIVGDGDNVAFMKGGSMIYLYSI